MKTLIQTLVVAAALLLLPSHSRAQAVAVTMRLDTNSITAGGSTFLRVYAQVVPALRSSADRIFSWYVDVLNTNSTVAGASYDAMVKPTSDNDPLLSSSGVTQGAHRRGIYDTFLNLPAAGTIAPVELMRIPVTGLSAGTTRFFVQPGSGVPALSSDFLVAPSAGSTLLSGGDYSAAQVELSVTGSTGCNLDLDILQGAGGNLTLTFTPCPGKTHTVEARAALGDVAGWQALPGAPHNSGSVTVASGAPQRFFRVRATTP